MNPSPTRPITHRLFAWLVLSVLLILPAAPARGFSAPGSLAAPAGQLADLPLLSISDLAYLGAFRLPGQDGAGDSLAYGGYALGLDPDRTGLFLGGHDWYQRLCEVSIPDATGLDQVASILQDCTDVTEGRLGLVDEGSIKLGGTLVYDGRLVVSAYSYYDADGSQALSHFISGTDLLQAGDIQGPYQAGDWAGIISGYLAPVPPEWQAVLGGPVLTGNCCLSIISRTSYGPAVSAFDPDELGVLDPAPTQPLLYYPGDHPLADWDSTGPDFNGSTQIAGVAFPEETRSLLFFGRQGLGPFCYGTGEACDDPVDPYKGTHAYPYVHQVWAYDALELSAVVNGSKQPWEVKPYALWQLDEMDSSGGATIAGAAFDPASGRVYLTERYGEDPIVHVYQITVPDAPLPAASAYLPLVR